MANFNRGFTLVEMMLVLGLSTIVMGTAIGLYGYVMNAMAMTAAIESVSNEARVAADEIEQTIKKAQSCNVISLPGVYTLNCVMSKNATDRANDEFNEVAEPDSLTPRRQLTYGSGQTVTFARSSANGSMDIGGNLLNRYTYTGVLPVLDKSFNYFANDTSRPRISRIRSFLGLVNASTRTVTFTITVAGSSQNSSYSAGDKSLNNEFRMTEIRTVQWRNALR